MNTNPSRIISRRCGKGQSHWRFVSIRVHSWFKFGFLDSIRSDLRRLLPSKRDLLRAWIGIVIGLAALMEMHAAGFPPFTAGRNDIRITNSPPQAAADEVKWRLHAQEDPPPFRVAREKFQLIVPPAYRHDESWGLFIWISPGDTPAFPSEWETVLAARRLILVGAYNAGNERNIFDRVRLAVSANVELRKRFNLDGRRVYVAGFSGGGRVASMLGVAWADMFSGTLPFMGVNFYTDVTAADGKIYGLNFIPDDEVLALAKKNCRYVLVTGEKDFNRANTKAVFEKGFRQEGFSQVRFLEVPMQGHAPPPAKWLEEGLSFLDGGKKVP